MMRPLFIILILISYSAAAQFTGKGGVYFLGAADIPVAAYKFSNPDISGVVCRFRWETLEPAPGNFNWSFIDGEILKAQNASKKISLQPLGYPQWIVDSMHAQIYYYIDENPNHSTYGQIISGVLPWDSVYLSRVKLLMQELAAKYSGDTTVSYLNMIGAQVSRNLPDTVVVDTTLMIIQPFWTAFNYDADSLAPVLNDLTDYYMTLFPSTPLWCSVDYVKFEMSASSRPINYLASLYTSYGLANYPDRFGLFREDLSGCNPQQNVSPGSHWFIMKENPCATGAQMLWNVQDGPDRMNQCNMVPNTESFVLDSAIQNGLTLGMRYMEIYGSDIDDSLLAPVIASANNNLLLKAAACLTTSIEASAHQGKIEIWPNPASDFFYVDFKQVNDAIIEIYNEVGAKVFSKKIKGATAEPVSVGLESGVYFCKVNTADFILQSKLMIIR